MDKDLSPNCRGPYAARARGLIAAELVMGKLAPFVHPVCGIEPVVRGDGIVRSRDVAGARKVHSSVVAWPICPAGEGSP
jgi:hypothetical protein